MLIYLRVYRTHDHDLMALHHTRALNIRNAVREAIISYYTGKPLKIQTPKIQKPNIKTMPWSVCVAFQITEHDADGIVSWLQSIPRGYRNCLFKNILRHFLDDPGIWFFREDDWEPKEIPKTEEIEPVMFLFKRKQRNQDVIGNEWVQSLASETKKKKPVKKITDINELLDADKQESSSMPNKQVDNNLLHSPISSDMPDEEDDGFDAFAAFEELRKGD